MGLENHFKEILTLPCVVIPDKQLVFFRVPKVAGTSIHHGYFREHYLTLNKKTSNRAFSEWHKNITYKQFESLFKFTFVRNPWDRFVSLYVYFTSWVSKYGSTLVHRWKEDVPSFTDFTMNFGEILETREDIKNHAIPQTQFAYCDGEMYVDFIGRFERLKEDFGDLLKMLNLKIGKLPHLTKTERLHYSHYYDEDTKKRVGSIYEEDIETFGYSYRKSRLVK